MSFKAKSLITKLLAALVVYSAVGFWLLPGLALDVVNKQLAKRLTVPARLASLDFNPFTLELKAGAWYVGNETSPQLAFEQLYANLQLDSIWQRAVHLADVELTGAHLEVLFAADGRLNLAQLITPSDSPPVTKDGSDTPFPVRIDQLTLIDNSLRFEDLRPSKPVEFGYDALNLQLNNLSTLAEDKGSMTLLASGPYGTELNWEGEVSLVPLTSTGLLRVTDGRLEPFWPYARDLLPLELKQGSLNASIHYHFDLSAGTELQLKNSSLSLAPLAINSVEGEPLLSLARLEVSDASVDLSKQHIELGSVDIDQLKTHAAREADGSLDWQRRLHIGTAESAGASSAEPAEPVADSQEATDAAQPWQVIVRALHLREAQVRLEDRLPAQQVSLDLGPLDIEMADFDSLGTTPFTFQLSSGINADGQLTLQGQSQLSPFSAAIKVASQDLDLRLAQAYLAPFVRIDLRSGRLNSQLAVDLKSLEPLALHATGSADIAQLHILDTLAERDLLKWQHLHLNGIDYRDDQLVIDNIALQQPYARFVINKDLTTNISDLLIPQPEAEVSSTGQPLGIHIGGVEIKDGSAHFADFSLRPNFSTALQELHGQIGTLDNQQAIAASVDLTGKVDRYAPVTIKGSLMPFDPLNSLDIATRFKNMELTTLTPYSGKFAGYRIRKGRLNLDLHYRIHKGQLQADNKVLLEGLQLGERVDSPDAVDLPVRLAIALLKDSKGNINIELPVSGDLNNPQFSVMPIVWKTLRNLVVRATQAPFKFIGGLVSGGNDTDLSQVDFALGTAELDSQAHSVLNTLAAALSERPVLRLEVEGAASREVDGPLVAQQQLESEYQAAQFKQLQGKGRTVPASPDELVVTDKQKAKLLESIYQARIGQDAAHEGQSLSKQERLKAMHTALLASWQTSPALLRRLAQARAAAIKDYLVDSGKLDAQRIYLLDANTSKEGEQHKVATTLQLGSD